MKSATSCFNRGMFLKSVLRFWPIWAIYTFVQLLALPLNLISPLSAGAHDALSRNVLDTIYLAEFVCPLAACASAMAVFSHLYSERSAGFFAALPIRRGAMFLSQAAAGLAPLLAANTVILAISFAVEAVFGFCEPRALMLWYGAVTLMTVAYFGIAVFCAQLTGHIVVMPVLFVVFGVAASWLGNMALVVPDMFCYGYSSGGDRVTDLFSPFVCLSANLTYSRAGGEYAVNGWSYLLAYGALGVLLLPVSMALYNRRDMESAGDVVAIAPLRPVFELMCSFAAAFLLGNLFYTLPFGSSPADGSAQAALYVLCMSVAAFIGWFVAAMLVTKSFSVFNRPGRFLGWAVVSLVCAALVFSCELDVTGYETRVPDAGEVQSVHVSAGGAAADFDEPENIAAAIAVHSSAVAAREENEAARAGSYAGVWLRMDYSLDGGRELSREYFIASDGRADTLDLLQELMNSDEGISGRKDPGIPMNASTILYGTVTLYDQTDGTDTELLELDAAEALELYRDCILPDMRDKTIGLVWYRTDEEYYNSVYNCRIGINAELQGDSFTSFYTVPTVYSERTNAWLLDHGVELKTLAETGSDAVG